MLEGCWDEQLPHLIHHVFPLSFNREVKLNCSDVSHSTTREFPDHVESYLKEEIKFSALMGSFQEPPITNVHVSPFLTRDCSGEYVVAPWLSRGASFVCVNLKTCQKLGYTSSLGLKPSSYC